MVSAWSMMKNRRRPSNGPELNFAVELTHPINTDEILVGFEEQDVWVMTGGFLHAGRTLSTQFIFLAILAIGQGSQAQGQCLLSYTVRTLEKAGLGKWAATQDLNHSVIANKVSQSHAIPSRIGLAWIMHKFSTAATKSSVLPERPANAGAPARGATHSGRRFRLFVTRTYA